MHNIVLCRRAIAAVSHFCWSPQMPSVLWSLQSSEAFDAFFEHLQAWLEKGEFVHYAFDVLLRGPVLHVCASADITDICRICCLRRIRQGRSPSARVRGSEFEWRRMACGSWRHMVDEGHAGSASSDTSGAIAH